MVTRKKETEASPVYDYSDPDRIAFIQQNAVAMVQERDEIILRQREEIARLSNSLISSHRFRKDLQFQLEHLKEVYRLATSG